MDFDDLQALLWVKQHGSLQGAARAEGVSRTTLRRRLERLETSVGKPVCVTSADGIALTAAGASLVERGPHLLAERDRLLDAARGAFSPGNAVRMLVGLGAPPPLTSSVVATLVSLVPGVRFHLDFDSRPLDRLDEGFDVVVYWGDTPPPRAGYSRALLRLPMCVLGAPAYLDARGRPSTVEELADHALIHLAGSPSTWPRVGGGVVHITPTHTATDLYMVGCLAADGLGLALMPTGGLRIPETFHAFEPLLGDEIAGEAVVRVFVPVPTQPGSATQALVEVIENLAESVEAAQRRR